MPRPKLSPEEKAKRKRENDKRYYENHKDLILEKQKTRYTPEVRQEMYRCNAEELCKKRRERYSVVKQNHYKERIEDLKTAIDDSLKPVVDYLLKSKVYERLFNNEITLLENILLMTTNDMKESSQEQLMIVIPSSEEC